MAVQFPVPRALRHVEETDGRQVRLDGGPRVVLHAVADHEDFAGCCLRQRAFDRVGKELGVPERRYQDRGIQHQRYGIEVCR